MLQCSSSLLFPLKPPTPLPPLPATHRRVRTTPLRRRQLLAAVSPLASYGRAAAAGAGDHTPRPSFAAASSPGFPSSSPGSNLVVSPGPEMGLLSLFFVIFMVIGSFVTVAVVSLPAMWALRKLSKAMDRLSKVAAEEVPGTLLSLKLSGREINELTQQLCSLKGIISRNRGHRKEDRMKKRWSKRGGDDPLIV